MTVINLESHPKHDDIFALCVSWSHSGMQDLSVIFFFINHPFLSFVTSAIFALIAQFDL